MKLQLYLLATYHLLFTAYHCFLMRIIFNLLVIFASLLSLFILALFVHSLIYGKFNVLLPGLGLVISFWGIMMPLLVIDASIIVMAFLIRQFGLQNLS